MKVSTSLGEIKGSVIKTRGNRNVNAFYNIPYAKPPIGRLRFALPEPLEPWSGCLNAAKPKRIMCIQPFFSMPDSVVIGSEDCLYLHVFTPKMPKSGTTELLPVMIFIHGMVLELLVKLGLYMHCYAVNAMHYTILDSECHALHS